MILLVLLVELDFLLFKVFFWIAMMISSRSCVNESVSFAQTASGFADSD